MSNEGKWDLTTRSYEQALTNEKVCDFTQSVAQYTSEFSSCWQSNGGCSAHAEYT
jgi:hypothetical protein